MLPLSLSAVAGAAALPPAVLQVIPLPSQLPFTPPSRGVLLQVTATGVECGAVPLWNVSAVAPLSSLAYSQAFPAPSVAVHTFACLECTFTSLSTLTVTFPPTCQSFTVVATAVSSEGVLTVASVPIVGPPVRVNAGDAVLSAAIVALQPTLETYAPLGAPATRGYRIAVSSVSTTPAPAPGAVTLTFALAQPPYYVDISVVQLQSRAQLLSSLVGLLGLIGALAAAFYVMEQCVERVCGTSRRKECCRFHDAVSGPGSGVWLSCCARRRAVYRLSAPQVVIRRSSLDTPSADSAASAADTRARSEWFPLPVAAPLNGAASGGVIQGDDDNRRRNGFTSNPLLPSVRLPVRGLTRGAPIPMRKVLADICARVSAAEDELSACRARQAVADAELAECRAELASLRAVLKHVVP